MKYNYNVKTNKHFLNLNLLQNHIETNNGRNLLDLTLSLLTNKMNTGFSLPAYGRFI